MYDAAAQGVLGVGVSVGGGHCAGGPIRDNQIRQYTASRYSLRQ